MHKTTTINFCVASLELELLSSFIFSLEVLCQLVQTSMLNKKTDIAPTLIIDLIASRPFSRAFLSIGGLPALFPVNF